MNETLTKRDFLKLAAGAVADVIVISTIGPKVAHSQGSISEVPNPQAPAQTIDKVSKILKLDEEIYQDPNKLDEAVGDLADFSCRTMAQELNVEFRWLRNNQVFLNDTEFNLKLEEENSCVIKPPPGVLGFVIFNSEKAYINLDRARFSFSNRPLSHAATNIIHISMHEAHHQANLTIAYEIPETIKTRTGTYDSTITSGGSSFIRYKEFDKVGRECLGSVYPHIEEGIVEQSTSMKLLELQLLGYSNLKSNYRSQVRAYQATVINKFMNGDYRELRDIKTKRGQREMFKRLGQVIKTHPDYSNDAALQSVDDQFLGKNHLLRMIPPL